MRTDLNTAAKYKYRKGNISDFVYRYCKWLVQLTFGNRNTARKCVHELRYKMTNESNLYRGDCLRLIIDGHRLANSRWTSDSFIMAALKPTWLCSFSCTATDYVMSCHVMSCHTLPCDIHPITVISRISFGHCTPYMSRHTGRERGAVGTQLLQVCCCLMIISLSVTADGYRTFRRH